MDTEVTPTTIGDGRYAIDRRIGIGGGGAVYLAHDTLLNRWVAIKKVMDGLGQGDGLDAFREARQLASLQHPNIVTLYDFLNSDGDLFVVMEYVAGHNIDELDQPMAADFFVDFARQCLEALSAAHSIGLVHRDIKPGNIMLAALPSGSFQAKLLDFGMAKIMPEPSLQTMDHAGAITGSIFMISPEQLSRQPIDHRSDLYSLGCVFYQALMGFPPFRGDDVPALIAAHLQHDFTSLADLRPDLPPNVAGWVEKLFSYNKDDRPSSAAEALLELDAILKPAPKPRPDASGKPALVNPLAPAQPAKKKKAPPKEDAVEPEKPERTPFHRTQNFVIAMAAVGAVCLTIIVLALTGHLGGGGGNSGSKPNPFAKKKTEATPAPKTVFRSNERGEIKDQLGKKITVTGVVGRVEEDYQADPRTAPKEGRFVLFKDAGPRDVVLFFAPETSVGLFGLKKFLGQKIRATGTVAIEGDLLLLDVASKEDLQPDGEAPAPSPAN